MRRSSLSAENKKTKSFERTQCRLPGAAQQGGSTHARGARSQVAPIAVSRRADHCSLAAIGSALRSDPVLRCSVPGVVLARPSPLSACPSMKTEIAWSERIPNKDNFKNTVFDLCFRPDGTQVRASTRDTQHTHHRARSGGGKANTDAEREKPDATTNHSRGSAAFRTALCCLPSRALALTGMQSICGFACAPP